MSRQRRSTKDKVKLVDWILALNEILTMESSSDTFLTRSVILVGGTLK